MKAKTLLDLIVQDISVYDVEESKEIAFLLIEKLYGKNKTDIILNSEIENFEENELKSYLERINHSEPIQYIFNEAWFRGNKFYVDKNVLIPRPETEEIVDLANKLSVKKVIDLGTGSGCIPISIALENPQSEVYAIDISENALNVAKKNALDLKAKVNFAQANILDFKNPFENQKFDLIISNPPYVKDNEKGEIRENVLAFEPHLALFVTDADPLIFYEKIAEIGKTILNANGKILVEINSYLGHETAKVFTRNNYNNVELIQDFFGRDRFVLAHFNENRP